MNKTLSLEYLKLFSTYSKEDQLAIIAIWESGAPKPDGDPVGCSCGTCPPNSYCGKVNGQCKCIGE